MRAARLTVLCGALVVSACSTFTAKDSAPTQKIDVSTIPDAIPHDEPVSKYGNPTSYEVEGQTYRVMLSGRGYRERGIASWYGTKFHGQRTSSGEPYDMYAMTAAHKTLPLPSYARVTNLQNGRSVVVRINDRGPFKENRLIDLSYAAAIKLGITGTGTGMVEVRVVDTRRADAEESTPARDTPRLFVQLGAFAQEENAQRLAARLQSEGVDHVQVSRTSNNENPLYRVRVGPLPSVEHADSLARRLLDLGFNQRRIVVD